MSELRPVSFRKPVKHEPRLSTPYVPGVRHPRFWTEAQKDIVRRYYPTGGLVACLAHLPPEKQSKSGIYVLAQKLGLQVERKNGDGPNQKITAPAGFDDVLRSFYQNASGKKRGECDAFADAHRLPRWWVTKRATKLGLVVPSKKEPLWTAPELALLARLPLHDPHKSAKIMREHGFQRTPTSIMVKATRMKLSRQYRETLSATAISRILGIDAKSITREILQGDLTAEKRPTNRLAQQGGDPWSVTPANLRRYILDNIERIDLRKVEKFAFVQIVAGEQLDTVNPPSVSGPSGDRP